MAGLGTRSVPACCVGAYPILDEIKAIEPDALDWRDKLFKVGESDTRKGDRRSDSATPERTEAAKVVFNKPRPECPKWFPHTPGLSPGQHLEAFQMQKLEEDRRAFELRLFGMSQKVQEDSAKIAKNSLRFTIAATFVIVLLALIGTVAAVISIQQNSRPLEVNAAIPVVVVIFTPIPPTETPVVATPSPEIPINLSPVTR